MAVHPREEQETIIRRDVQLGTWFYYSDNPADNKKWQPLIEATRCEVEPSGQISVLEGTISGTVTLRPKPKPLTSEQRTERVNRLAKHRMQN